MKHVDKKFQMMEMPRGGPLMREGMLMFLRNSTQLSIYLCATRWKPGSQNWSLHPNHVGSLLKYRLLHPTRKVSDLVGRVWSLLICISRTSSQGVFLVLGAQFGDWYNGERERSLCLFVFPKPFAGSQETSCVLTCFFPSFHNSNLQSRS